MWHKCQVFNALNGLLQVIANGKINGVSIIQNGVRIVQLDPQVLPHGIGVRVQGCVPALVQPIKLLHKVVASGKGQTICTAFVCKRIIACGSKQQMMTVE